MKNTYFFVANWKMYLTVDEAIQIAIEHCDKLEQLAKKPHCEIILCPSFTALYPLSKTLGGISIKLGGQNCSTNNKGAFTGQESVKSLKCLNCRYCIIGHSEQRKHCCETNKNVAKKCLMLLELGISPIICVGEEAEENEKGLVLDVLDDQLKEVFVVLEEQQYRLCNLPICIAYEPIWAIGTENIPSKEHIEVVFAWINKQIQQKVPKLSCFLLYGGSVSSSNVAMLKDVEDLNGLLIGKASLDFQELEKIVNCICCVK
jgi:triosephosphate isomerase (TIM)